MIFDNTYVTIDLDCIARNFDAVQAKAGVPVMVVVKADAYGHGAVQIARHLQDKCAFFGVSSISEALELRRGGIRTPILILGHTPSAAFGLAVEQDIRPSIFSLEGAKKLSEEACRQGKTAAFHFALDTGMSRIGFQADEQAADDCAEAARLPGVFAEGLFSHFATADCADLTKAQAQAELFDRFVDMLKERGLQIPICHLDNSAGVMNFSRHYDMVRSGIVTYGLYPSEEVEKNLLALEPAMIWRSRITHVKTLPAGREISYGGTFVTDKPTVVATVPVGYADGYRRSLSGKFYVLVHGVKAPILGRICMDQMMVDVSNVPDVAVGNKVVLMGEDRGQRITAQELAEAAGTFPYELICGISRRVPRYYRQNGETVHTVHHLLDK